MITHFGKFPRLPSTWVRVGSPEGGLPQTTSTPRRPWPSRNSVHYRADTRTRPRGMARETAWPPECCPCQVPAGPRRSRVDSTAARIPRAAAARAPASQERGTDLRAPGQLRSASGRCTGRDGVSVRLVSTTRAISQKPIASTSARIAQSSIRIPRLQFSRGFYGYQGL